MFDPSNRVKGYRVVKDGQNWIVDSRGSYHEEGLFHVENFFPNIINWDISVQGRPPVDDDNDEDDNDNGIHVGPPGGGSGYRRRMSSRRLTRVDYGELLDVENEDKKKEDEDSDASIVEEDYNDHDIKDVESDDEKKERCAGHLPIDHGEDDNMPQYDFNDDNNETKVTKDGNIMSYPTAGTSKGDGRNADPSRLAVQQGRDRNQIIAAQLENDLRITNEVPNNITSDPDMTQVTILRHKYQCFIGLSIAEAIEKYKDVITNGYSNPGGTKGDKYITFTLKRFPLRFNHVFNLKLETYDELIVIVDRTGINLMEDSDTDYDHDDFCKDKWVEIMKKINYFRIDTNKKKEKFRSYNIKDQIKVLIGHVKFHPLDGPNGFHESMTEITDNFDINLYGVINLPDWYTEKKLYYWWKKEGIIPTKQRNIMIEWGRIKKNMRTAARKNEYSRLSKYAYNRFRFVIFTEELYKLSMIKNRADFTPDYTQSDYILAVLISAGADVSNKLVVEKCRINTKIDPDQYKKELEAYMESSDEILFKRFMVLLKAQDQKKIFDRFIYNEENRMELFERRLNNECDGDPNNASSTSVTAANISSGAASAESNHNCTALVTASSITRSSRTVASSASFVGVLQHSHECTPKKKSSFWMNHTILELMKNDSGALSLACHFKDCVKCKSIFPFCAEFNHLSEVWSSNIVPYPTRVSLSGELVPIKSPSDWSKGHHTDPVFATTVEMVCVSSHRLITHKQNIDRFCERYGIQGDNVDTEETTSIIESNINYAQHLYLYEKLKKSMVCFLTGKNITQGRCSDFHHPFEVIKFHQNLKLRIYHNSDSDNNYYDIDVKKNNEISQIYRRVTVDNSILLATRNEHVLTCAIDVNAHRAITIVENLLTEKEKRSLNLNFKIHGNKYVCTIMDSSLQQKFTEWKKIGSKCLILSPLISLLFLI